MLRWVDSPYEPPADLEQYTQRAIDMYMNSKQEDGTMGGIGWWQTANGYTAIAMHDLWSHSQQNYSVLNEAVKTAESHQHDLLNEYNDDTIWWAMLCLHLYNQAGESWFLDKAKNIWREMHRRHAICQEGEVWFRGQDMKGACFWTDRQGEEQINAVTTGLYAELSCRLAMLCNDGQRGTATDEPSRNDYIQAAIHSLGWIFSYRYRAEEGIVLDHILLRQDREVDWTFTYTTGIAMGVCALLFKLGRQEYLEIAIHMANKALRRESWIDSDGILLEWDAFGHGKDDPWQNSDGVGFKAVLIRHLGTLYEVLNDSHHDQAKESAELIKTFVNINFQSQQQNNTNGNDQYGPWWAGPFEAPTSHSQMAVLDVMAVVRLVNAR